MFELNSDRKYLSSICTQFFINFFINLFNLMSILVRQIKSTYTSDHLFFGESLKSESVWDHTVNVKFNVSYLTFGLQTFLFLFMSRFLTFLTFCILI